MLPTFSRLMLKRFNTFFDRLFNQLLSRANNLKQDANAKGAFVQSLKPCEWENGFSLFFHRNSSPRPSATKSWKLDHLSSLFCLVQKTVDLLRDDEVAVVVVAFVPRKQFETFSTFTEVKKLILGLLMRLHLDIFGPNNLFKR